MPFWRKPARPRRGAGITLTERDTIPPAACAEGVVVVGQTGSGKSTGLARRFLRAFLRENYGFLVLCAKSDEFDNIYRVACQEGRGGDVVRFGPGSGECFNIMGFELSQPGASAVSVAQVMDAVVESASRQSLAAAGENAFFVTGSQRGTRAGIETVRLANGTATIKDIYRCLGSAARSIEEYQSAEWAASSFCGKCLAKAVDNGATPEQMEMIALWWQEYAELHEKTRSSIHMNMTSILERFCFGEMASLVAAEGSTVTPVDIQNGAIVIVDCPVLRYREPGRFVNIAWKLAAQRQVLRNPGPRPVVTWADECQWFCTPEHDMLTQTVARSHRLISVAMTQSLAVLMDQFGGNDRARQQVAGWLGNHNIKILGTNSDKITNETFSAMLGQSMQPSFGGNLSGAEFDPVRHVLGQPLRVQASVHEVMRPNVEPGEFARLAPGGPPDFAPEVIVYRGGQPFENGKHYLRVRTPQDV